MKKKTGALKEIFERINEQFFLHLFLVLELLV